MEQPNSVFRNLGGARFQVLTEEAGLAAQPPRRHRGSAVGDLIRDGRLDVVVSALAAPAEVWINTSPGDHHWLDLELEGADSNRDGIGARIMVVAGGSPQYHQVMAPHACEGPIGGIATLHVDAAMPNFLVQEICSGVQPGMQEKVWEEWLGFPAMRMVNALPAAR